MQLDTRFPVPTSSGTPGATAISTAYEGNDWSRDTFFEVTGPAASGPVQTAFGSKEDALAFAAGLSHGTQPAVAVLYEHNNGPRGTTPWVIEALQMANPSPDGFISRANKFIQTGWNVHTEKVDLEASTSSIFREFVAKAPFASTVHAIVDGTILIEVARPKG